MATASRPQLVAAPKQRSELLVAAPLSALADQLEQEIEVLQRRAPDSELVTTLRSVRADLLKAIETAREVAVWLSVEQVHEHTGVPVSTITRECRKRGKAAGAIKEHGSWWIHWPTWSRLFGYEFPSPHA